MRSEQELFRGRNLKKKLIPKVHRGIKTLQAASREAGMTPQEAVSTVANDLIVAIVIGTGQYIDLSKRYRKRGLR